jgi:M-phase inducer tyrosine phosphatase
VRVESLSKHTDSILSPQLATPRRSLFTSSMLAHANGYGRISVPEYSIKGFAKTGVDDVMTTPPLPASSPAPAMDVMDLSPLPHKPAFVVTTEFEVHSPSPYGSPMLSPLESPLPSAAPSPLQASPMEAPIAAPE